MAKALERTLRTRGVLPARAIESLTQMQQVFTDVPVLLLDATERPQHWPRAVVDRVADYSDKKRLTRENTLIADPSRYIHYLGLTTYGFTHDYQLLKNELNANLGLLDLFALLADSGYLNVVTDYDLPLQNLPHRKSRRSKKRPDAALSNVQRTDNVAHAHRVKVEHATRHQRGQTLGLRCPNLPH